MDAERLIYSLTNRLVLVKEDKVRHMPTKVECKALLDTLADKETEVKVHTLGEYTLGDTQVEVYTKALDY